MLSKLVLVNAEGNKVNELNVTHSVLKNLMQDRGEMSITIKIQKESYEIASVNSYDLISEDNEDTVVTATEEILTLEIYEQE